MLFQERGKTNCFANKARAALHDARKPTQLEEHSNSLEAATAFEGEYSQGKGQLALLGRYRPIRKMLQRRRGPRTKSILPGWRKVLRLNPFGCGFVHAALPLEGDSKLAVRVCEGGIGSNGFLVTGDRIGDLAAQQQLIAGVQGEGRLLAIDSRAAEFGGLPAILGCLTPQFTDQVSLLIVLLLVSGRLAGIGG